MSRDPNEGYSEYQDEGERGYDVPSYPPMEDRGRRNIVERVRLPAIFLLIIGGINLLGCLYFLVDSLYITLTPQAQIEKQNAQMYKMMGVASPGQQPGQRGLQLAFIWGLTFGNFITTALVFLAGARMLVLRNYALCIVGTIAAALPCLSCPGGCLLGQGVGIWALVVLMSEDVREMFR